MLPRDRIARLQGYGLVQSGDGYVYRPTSADQIPEVLELARKTGRGITLRGAGRSYGDASVGAESIVLDLSRMNQVRAWDPNTGLLEVGAGATIETLWRTGIEDGYWPHVVSGTMFPTVAGAIGMNIHGKNNFREGVFGEHLESLEIMTADGEARTVRPEDADFHAFPGSFGSLAITTGATIRLKKVPSGDLQVLPVSVPNLEAHFRAFEGHEGNADYMVSWLDAHARGGGLGRGLFHAAWYLDVAEGAGRTLRLEHQDLPDSILGFFPKSQTYRILRLMNTNPGMRLLNAAKHHASAKLGNGRGHPQSLVGFSFLLDYVPNWRLAYRHGFAQVQVFVPRASAPDVFRRILQRCQEKRWPSNLVVLKRHRPDSFLVSHGVDGYSMAMDFRLGREGLAELAPLARWIYDQALEAGGRLYPAKDSVMTPQQFRASVGEDALTRLRSMKESLDPQRLLSSSYMARTLDG